MHLKTLKHFKHFFFSFLGSDEILSQTEKQRYDGWFNNLAHPEWGAVGK